MFLLKIIEFLWPFIKEIVTGNKTAASRSVISVLKLFFTIILILSLIINFFTIHKLIKLDAKVKQPSVTCTIPKIDIVTATPESTIKTIGNEFAMLDESTKGNKSNVCPKFRLEKFTTMPPLPVEEISKIDPDNSLQISLLEKEYIIKLYTYTTALRKSLLAQYSKYLTDCPDLPVK